MVRVIVDETKNNNNDVFISRQQHHQASSNERTPLIVVSSKSTGITSKTSTDDDDEEDGAAAAAEQQEQQQQQENSNNHNAAVLLNHARRLIYVSHTFSQASEVAWQFGLILFLAAFTHYESMILVSTYGMLSYMAVCLFGATAGRFVDGTNRLYAAQWFIWTENASVLMATILCYILLLKLRNENNNINPQEEEEEDDDDNIIMSSYWLYGVPTDRTSILLLLGIHFWGPLAMILDKGFLVAMERDWIVVMSRQAKGTSSTSSSSTSASSHEQQQHQQTSATSNDNDNNDIGDDDENDKRDAAAQAEWLSTTNVAMKQIDLTCKVIAPAVVGFVIAAFDTDSDSSTSFSSSSSSNSQNNAASTDLTGAVLLVGAVNIAALVVEYVCTARVYYLIPALAVKEEPSAESSHHHRQLSRDSSILVETDWSSTVSERSLSPFKAAAPELFASSEQQQLSTNGEYQHDQDDDEEAMRSEQPLPLHRSKPNPNVAVAAAATTAGNEHATVTDCGMGREIRRCCCCGRRHSSRQLHFTFHRFRRRLLPDGLRIYLKQPISWGGMGLALLYLNCLTFGALMTAYLVWRGMRFETVGIWRGISSALGLSGTVAYHSSVQKTTLVNTGMWSIILEFFCLSLCFASFFVHDFDISVAMLIAGVCFSRIGLWVFDITITQLQQEFIPFGIRGVVGGTQQSLNAFFQLGSFALGLIFPDPRDFWIYALAGWVAIGLAVLFYAVGIFVRAPQFWTTAEKATSKGLAPSTL